MSKLEELANLGQSIWLDYIQRSLITSGELKDLVDQGLRGVTSNPSIFDKAIYSYLNPNFASISESIFDCGPASDFPSFLIRHQLQNGFLVALNSLSSFTFSIAV